MFSGCSGMTSIDLSNFNTAEVTDMSSMFEGCSSLTTLDLSSFNTSKLIYNDSDQYFDDHGVQSMFSGCNKLTTIYVGDG